MNKTIILNQLSSYALERTAVAKTELPLSEMKKASLDTPDPGFAFTKAISKKGLSFICECKKASPSKGLISPDFPYLKIAEDYEAAGADCISVLTEPKWFLGSGLYLKEIAETVHIPCLRKDFTVDEYMIYEARLLKASAILLICSILSPGQLSEYLGICGELGLSALVEAHDEKEIEMAVKAGADIIGINNRDLKDFSVDHDLSLSLKRHIPDGVLFVSESGIQNAADVKRLHDAGADAVLIGEALMTAPDKKARLAELRSLL